MKFTFICEDDGTRVEHTVTDMISWVVLNFHYQQFLLGCGFVFKEGYKVGMVQGDPTENLDGRVEYE